MQTLYVSDLDGTLLNRQDRLSDFTLQTLNRLMEGGLLFTYATARSIHSARIVTKGLSLLHPVIVSNGVFLMDPKTGERIFSTTFTQDERDFIQQLLTRLDVSPMVYAYLEGHERASYRTDRVNQGIRHYLDGRPGDSRMRPITPEAGQLDKAIQTLYEGEAYYYTCIGTYEEMLLVWQALSSHPDYNCVMFQELYRPEYWCEIMPRNASKANAAQILKERLGCNRIVAFGDAVNDLPLFSVADECYAVSNAVPALKNAATGILPSNEEDGVAHWLLEQFA